MSQLSPDRSLPRSALWAAWKRPFAASF